MRVKWEVAITQSVAIFVMPILYVYLSQDSYQVLYIKQKGGSACV